MTEIKEVVIQELLNHVRSSIIAGVIVIDEAEIRVPIYEARIRGNMLRIYLKLNSDIRGFISKGRLVDEMGRTWFEKDFNYSKGPEGFILVFPYRQDVQPFLNDEERARYE